MVSAVDVIVSLLPERKNVHLDGATIRRLPTREAKGPGLNPMISEKGKTGYTGSPKRLGRVERAHSISVDKLIREAWFASTGRGDLASGHE